MKALLKRALAVLQSYNAEEFCTGAEVMQDIRDALAKDEYENAYICKGCGAIYWEKVSCDCEVPSLHQFTQVNVYRKGTP